MPNVHAADKEIVSFFIPRPLAARLRKKARARGETLTALVASILTRETEGIELSPEDYKAIAEATRKTKGSGKSRTTQHPHSKSRRRKD